MLLMFKKQNFKKTGGFRTATPTKCPSYRWSSPRLTCQMMILFPLQKRFTGHWKQSQFEFKANTRNRKALVSLSSGLWLNGETICYKVSWFLCIPVALWNIPAFLFTWCFPPHTLLILSCTDLFQSYCSLVLKSLYFKSQYENRCFWVCFFTLWCSDRSSNCVMCHILSCFVTNSSIFKKLSYLVSRFVMKPAEIKMLVMRCFALFCATYIHVSTDCWVTLESVLNVKQSWVNTFISYFCFSPCVQTLYPYKFYLIMVGRPRRLIH